MMGRLSRKHNPVFENRIDPVRESPINSVEILRNLGKHIDIVAALYDSKNIPNNHAKEFDKCPGRWYNTRTLRAINSAGECYLHMVEVTGSNPVLPTKRNVKRIFV